jgi:hypothetical protein
MITTGWLTRKKINLMGKKNWFALRIIIVINASFPTVSAHEATGENSCHCL